MRISAAAAATAGQEWQRHWPVELGASVGIATGYAVWMYTASVFVVPLQEAFGWSRGQIALVSYAHILSGLCAPFIGGMIDRYRVRPILLSSMALVGLLYICLANMGGSLLAYYILSTLLVVIGMGTTGISFSRVITSWFVKSRGLALAVSRIGLALVGASLPMINYAIMADYGWQAGYFVMAALALCIGLPNCWLLVREPRDLPGHGDHAVVRAPALSIGRRALWDHVGNYPAAVILLTAALSYAALAGILSQLQPALISKGLEAGSAAQLTGLLAVSALVGALVTGALIDRFWAPAIGFIFMLGPVAGCAILVFGNGSYLSAGLAIFLIGFAQGAEFDIMSFLIARYLGMKAYSTIYGFCVLAMSLSTAAGGVFFGYSYDATGSYDLALLVSAGCFLAASLLYPTLGRYPEAPDT